MKLFAKVGGFLVLVSFILSFIPKAPSYRLIAHRGGVVEERFAENSPASIKEAIARGYWMIEVDIRETKDGKVIIQHDPNFKRFYNTDKKVSEMNWNEIKNLKSTPGNTAPLLFEELVKLSKGKLQLMLDTKEGHSPNLLEHVEKVLRDNNMLDSAYVIGTEASRRFFTGKAKVGVNRKVLQEVFSKGEDLTKYYLFEHGNELDSAVVVWAQKMKVPVVPSVNKFHYKDEDPITGGKRDIEKLKKLGVTEYQIDSEYDKFLK